MKKPSATYRFSCAFTALTMLLSVSIPAGLHAGNLADFCAIVMAEHNVMPIEADHEAHHNDMSTEARTNTESCHLGFTCCSIGKTAVKANAIPSLSKMFAGYIPVLVQILDDTPDPNYPKSLEQVFASLYSPPIFLKNNSFLN